MSAEWRKVLKKALGYETSDCEGWPSVSEILLEAPMVSLKELAILADLEKVRCYPWDIQDFEGLKFCPNLKIFDCSFTKLTSLEGLEACPNLKRLDCNDTKITSLDGLRFCPNLEFLDCSDTKITSLKELKFLPNLTELNCFKTEITSLEGIEHCQKLKMLCCSKTKITNLAALENCPKLEVLYCYDTQVPENEIIAFKQREVFRKRSIERELDEELILNARFLGIEETTPEGLPGWEIHDAPEYEEVARGLHPTERTDFILFIEEKERKVYISFIAWNGRVFERTIDGLEKEQIEKWMEDINKLDKWI